MARSFSIQAEQPLSTQQAFERLFAACRLQPSCRDAFPNIEQDFYAGPDDIGQHRGRPPDDVVTLSVGDAPAHAGELARAPDAARLPRRRIDLNQAAAGDQTRAPKKTIRCDQTSTSVSNWV